MTGDSWGRETMASLGFIVPFQSLWLFLLPVLPLHFCVPSGFSFLSFSVTSVIISFLSHLCSRHLVGASVPDRSCQSSEPGFAHVSQISLLVLVFTAFLPVSFPFISPPPSASHSFPRFVFGKRRPRYLTLLDKGWLSLAGQAVQGVALRLSSSAAIQPHLLLSPLVCPPCWSWSEPSALPRVLPLTPRFSLSACVPHPPPVEGISPPPSRSRDLFSVVMAIAW